MLAQGTDQGEEAAANLNEDIKFHQGSAVLIGRQERNSLTCQSECLEYFQNLACCRRASKRSSTKDGCFSATEASRWQRAERDEPSTRMYLLSMSSGSVVLHKEIKMRNQHRI